MAGNSTSELTIFEYRYDELLRMGCSPEVAVAVALNKQADLHDIERAIDAGCAFDLVGEIWA